MTRTLTILCALAALGLSGCSSGDNCTENDHTICHQGEVYWVDSCGNEGVLAEECGCGCNADYTGCDEPCDACSRTADCAYLGPNYFCDLLTGTCACAPQCVGLCCGDDGCGGVCADNCGAEVECELDSCECLPVGPCENGAMRCDGTLAQTCQDGSWITDTDCALTQLTCMDGECVDERCCPDQELYVDVSGVVRQLGGMLGVAGDVAAMAPLTALAGSLAKHEARGNFAGDGSFEIDCFDAADVSLGLMLLADDTDFDGTGGTYFPTLTSVVGWIDDNAKTCIDDTTAFVVNNQLMASLVVDIQDLDPTNTGVVIVMVLDADLRPLEDATVERGDGDPLTVHYPNADFTDYRNATSSNGTCIIAEPLSLTSLVGVKDGFVWDEYAFKAASVPGAVYFVALIADPK